MKLVEPHLVDATGRSAHDQQALAYARHAAQAIGNVATHMKLLQTSTHLLPVSVNEGGERADNSYVVSPLTTYVDYAEYEIRQLARPFLTWPLRGLVRGVGRWLARSRIDRIVQVNNWLLSTNLYPPDWDGADLPEMTRLLTQAYPEHVIGFRSLNGYSNPELIERLKALGYLPIPSRQVYLFEAKDGADSPYLRRQNTNHDARLLARTPYTQVQGDALSEADFTRIEHLYNLLYLEKYCPLNPHFTAQWLQSGQREGWLKLTALRSPEGSIDAVLGWFSNERIMTTPVVGYDTSLPQKLGLYRLISQISLEQAALRKGLLNMSAGAAHFKRMRGGQPEIEYSFVYVRHLPTAQARVWRVLSWLLHRIGVPLMRKLKL